MIAVSPAQTLLGSAIERQSQLVRSWRRPSEALLFETLRAIDDLFCREAFVVERSDEPSERLYYVLRSWGINKALANVMPEHLGHEPFRVFASTAESKDRADSFLLDCGILSRAELLQGWLTEGLVEGRIDNVSSRSFSGIKNVIVLHAAHPSLFQEIVALTHRKWMCDAFYRFDRPAELALEREHAAILPELTRSVSRYEEWGMSYSSDPAIDAHFGEWAKLYLRRMAMRDLIGPEERIGGSQFNEYLGLVVALSGRAQKRLCFASIMKQRHRDLDMRNLLTTFVPHRNLLDSLAEQFDADTLQIQKLLNSLTLEPFNAACHLDRGEPAWAPVVRSSEGFCILPVYGLDINPFLFLLHDLESKYPADWSRMANVRESRWRNELADLFAQPRWTTVARSVVLRENGKSVTDLDFVTYDTQSNELAIFQLKWQRPVGVDNRLRRSAGKNLTEETRRWITSVRSWLNRYGLHELANRAGLTVLPGVSAHIFVLARYNARFSGFVVPDAEVAWADWPHFLKALLQHRTASPAELAQALKRDAEEIRGGYAGESFMLPLGDLALLMSSSSSPEAQAPP